MAEVRLIRIRGIYGEAKGILESLEGLKSYSVPEETVEQYNGVVDELENISETDYSRMKVPDISLDYRGAGSGDYDTTTVKSRVSALVRRLEEEYDFGRSHEKNSPVIIVNENKNTNKTSIEINYTLKDLMLETSDLDARAKLSDLSKELEKKEKNDGKIRAIIEWIIAFSWELFLKVLPVIIKNYN